MRLPGQYFDTETGLHYNYYRYLDPESGRYLTADLVGLRGGLNNYSYVGGNPSYWIDPYGLASAAVWGTRTLGGAACLIPVPGMRVVGLGLIAATLTGDTPAVARDKAGLKVSPIAETLTPPGNCGNNQQKRLQKDVDNACKRPQSCRGSMSTNQLFDRLENNRTCAIARDRINKVCFSGGDRGHRNAAIDAWNAVVSCERLLQP